MEIREVGGKETEFYTRRGRKSIHHVKLVIIPGVFSTSLMINNENR
jgi:hypothetical protein